MRNTALWLDAILALPLVYVLRDPLLLQWRGVVTPLLFVTIALALLTLAWQWCKQATRTARPWLLGGGWWYCFWPAGKKGRSIGASISS